MSKFIVNQSIILSFILLFSWSASAQGLYLKGALGGTHQGSNSFMGGSVDYQGSMLGSLMFSVGMNWGQYFVTELEFSSRTVDLDYVNGTPAMGEVSAGMLGVNGLFNIPIGLHHRGFIGMGFGVLGVEMTDDLTGNFADGSQLARQYIVGAETAVSPRFDVSFELRHLVTDNLRLSGTSGAWGERFNYKNTSMLLGLKYNF